MSFVAPTPPVFVAPAAPDEVPPSQAIVANPAARQLVSKEEIDDIGGKVRALSKLFKNPRMHLAELSPTLTLLLTKLQLICACGIVPYTPEMRKYVDDELVFSKALEDVVIRVVVTGESVEDALARHAFPQ